MTCFGDSLALRLGDRARGSGVDRRHRGDATLPVPRVCDFRPSTPVQTLMHSSMP